MTAALIGLPALQALGLEAALHICAPQTEIISAADISGSAAEADVFIVSARAMATFARFFMPRLDSVLLITSSAQADAPMLMLSPLASLPEITRTLTTLLRHSGHNKAPLNAPRLTDRELDVVRLAASGRTAKEIAETLCISINTVLTHRKNIAAKTGMRSVSALTHFAMVHGLLN